MSGFELGQEYGHGRTFQRIVIPGTRPGDAAAPAAGANWSYSLQRWDRARLVFCTFALTTSNAVGNRYVTLEYPDVTSVSVVADGAAVLVAPSTTAQRFIGEFRRGQAEWNTGTDVFFPLCGIWMEAGQTVTINVAGIDVADQLSNIRMVFDTTPVRGDGSEIPRELDRLKQVTAEAAELAHALGV